MIPRWPERLRAENGALLPAISPVRTARPAVKALYRFASEELHHPGHRSNAPAGADRMNCGREDGILLKARGTRGYLPRNPDPPQMLLRKGSGGKGLSPRVVSTSIRRGSPGRLYLIAAGTSIRKTTSSAIRPYRPLQDEHFPLEPGEHQGWRLEIKKYPRLTEVGAWSTGAADDTVGLHPTDVRRSWTTRRTASLRSCRDDMPGTARPPGRVPGVSCTNGPFTVARAGESNQPLLCGQRCQLHFLEDVLAEVPPVPGTYIHQGGDECPPF